MKVYFVGAGPGDPELLTRKADRLIKGAPICIYAGSLVSPAILNLMPSSTQRHDSARLTLKEVIDLIVEASKAGVDVIRLHSGDPSIYGAIGEQIIELEKHGIAYEVVPGVSSFQAAAAALGWELTVPEVSQSIILTRSPGRTPMPKGESLESFAKTGATLCLFLSTHAVQPLAKSLAEHYGDSCSAAVVYHASWPDERVLVGDLSDIGAKVKEAGISKTAIFLVKRRGDGSASRLYDPNFEHGFRQKGGLDG
ncbi:MAG: precorrin-4 C(11)-methyltransferase [Actinomycetota bacterium]|nr:precorrin-4 C(11)-methyltransferase [Actinomycetota bacterium]